MWPVAKQGHHRITVEEGFRAWEHLSKYDIDHGVVLRSLAFEADEMLPTPILNDIAVRKTSNSAPDSGPAQSSGQGSSEVPAGGKELKDWLDEKVKGVISTVRWMVVLPSRIWASTAS